MYPRLRVDKLHPDGSLRASWEAYRMADHDGAVRLWTPVNTIVIHVNGRWVRPVGSVHAWRPGDPFVASYYEDAQGHGLYIDVVREVIVGAGRFAYTDLYVDVMFYRGLVTTKDEELLARLEPDEAERVLKTRDDLVRRVSAGDAPFSLRDPRWHVPDDVRELPPGAELTLS
jgi:uncharacterized protein DUF402